jgi:pyruvate formate lyase activating enzyme
MLGGGITVSGGEPLMQAEFVCELAEHLTGIHLAIQTSGYADPHIYQRVIGHFDYIMQDIKLADPTAHRHYTGVDNRRILDNIAWLKQSGKPFLLRVPLIPDITDTEENLHAIAAIAGDAPVELLRYNSLAGAKYETFGMTYPLSDRNNREEDYTRYFSNARMA